MIDIDAIAEQHYENFRDICSEDYELECLIWEHFAERIEQWRYWKEGIWNERPYFQAFETLYAWDADGFCENPKKCLKSHVEEFNFWKRSYEQETGGKVQ